MERLDLTPNPTTISCLVKFMPCCRKINDSTVYVSVYLSSGRSMQVQVQVFEANTGWELEPQPLGTQGDFLIP